MYNLSCTFAAYLRVAASGVLVAEPARDCSRYDRTPNGYHASAPLGSHQYRLFRAHEASSPVNSDVCDTLAVSTVGLGAYMPSIAYDE